MTKKKEKVAKKKEELAVPRDLTIENWSTDIDEQIKDSMELVWRTKACVIDAPSYIRGPPKTLPPHNSFLDYLEFRMNQEPTLFEKIFGKRL